MIKIFSILFLFFLFINQSYGYKEIKIISREEWGANEEYRYINSLEWKNILNIRENASKKEYSKEQLAKWAKNAERTKEINQILVRDYYNYIKLEKNITEENGRELAWPIGKTKTIKGIVIHHTYSDYEDSYDAVRKIYKYHAINREWGDIGYNFLIGKNGEIFEGRAGGDYAVAAHDKWNNRSTMGIALIGNYTDNNITDIQYKSLKKLTAYLIKKYEIDLTKKTYYHKECLGGNCDIPLETNLLFPIIGHRDAGHTGCPGDALYAQLSKLKEDMLREPVSVANIYKKNIYKKLSKFSDDKLLSLLSGIEQKLDKKRSSNKLKLKGILIDYFEYKNPSFQSSLEGGKKLHNKNIKIKLSYPHNDSITIKTKKGSVELIRKGNNIYFKGKKFNILTIPSKNNDILEISSWNRIPTWDKNGKYNDNKFRGDLIIYVKNNKLIVVNDLQIEDYLKGLGEVSDSENPKKIETIIIAARSYATWYTTKARKFEGELYDGSDDPNVFQKYLGYSLEQRSPNVNKIVSNTEGKLITYNGELIKPWYFSASTGNTMSFYDYCSIRYSDKICSKEAQRYPYLQSVKDYGSEGVKKGHGVGIAGTGVSYFADRGWTSEMIIKYFLKGVEVF